MFRRHFSVFMLMIRASLWRVLLVCACLVGAECVLFFLTAQKQTAALETVISESGLIFVFIAAFLLITAVLADFGCAYSVKCGYTLNRLSVSEKSVFAWQAMSNLCCFALLWVVQIITVFGLSMWLTQQDPSVFNNQTMFLAFYRSRFLHSLFPLEEINCHIRNVGILLGMSVATAWYPYKQRRGKTGIALFVFAVFLLPVFLHEIGSYGNTMFVLAVCVLAIAYIVYEVCTEQQVLDPGAEQ